MGTGKQYDEEFKKQAIKLASFMQQTSGSKSSKRKTVSLKSLMNFWRKHLLFSPRTFGSQERRTVKVHFPWKYQALADEMMKIHEEDQFDLMPLGIAIEDNMRASLCCHTLENANKSYPDIKGCIIHSDRGSQYTSEEYRAAVKKYGIIQSMNSAGGRCHNNARCESMWARMKEELFYSREDKPENYTMKELKIMV